MSLGRMRVLVLLLPLLCGAQTPIAIRVDSSASLGAFRPIWPFFGADEPNYTYAPNGAKLIGELGALRAPVFFRVHNLLTTGDGTPALKWGSTNAYRVDSAGNPIYDWTIVDRIFDTFLQNHAKPFVEIGFMPEALSTHPEPYQHSWPKTKIAAGWAYPPKDYRKWAELVHQWVRHAVLRYGEPEVNSWYWEVWNEPDIEYWQGTPAEYDQLYDYSADAVRRAAPHARVGGPASTGPAGKKAASFLQQFLEHCDEGVNAATGKSGAPLDFITYHAKGQPAMVDGHVRMGLGKNLDDAARGMDIVASFPRFRDLPIILSESDPEGCAACSARTNPQNAYRNGALYASYTAAAMASLLDLAREHKANLAGMLTWAFEFEDQPWFEAFRTLATNGVDKPILNFFRMAAMLGGDRVAVQSTAGIAADQILRSGVRETPDVDALATRAGRSVTVLVWNYHDDDVAAPDAPIRLKVAGLPASVGAVRLSHYRIDATHSNAFTAWKQFGSPRNPSAEQYRALESAGRLQALQSPGALPVAAGIAEIDFALPRQGLSLLQFTW